MRMFALSEDLRLQSTKQGDDFVVRFPLGRNGIPGVALYNAGRNNTAEAPVVNLPSDQALILAHRITARCRDHVFSKVTEVKSLGDDCYYHIILKCGFTYRFTNDADFRRNIKPEVGDMILIHFNARRGKHLVIKSSGQRSFPACEITDDDIIAE